MKVVYVVVWSAAYYSEYEVVSVHTSLEQAQRAKTNDELEDPSGYGSVEIECVELDKTE